jgi:hypothetical protein
VLAESGQRRLTKEQIMRGKYSPTVNAAYQKDQEWWTNYTYTGKHNRERECIQYDPEGYDAYGYNADELDRAGNPECAYYSDDCEYSLSSGNIAYDNASDSWGFDGTKPVQLA